MEYPIGTQYEHRNRLCTVVDVLKTYNSKNELVKVRYADRLEWQDWERWAREVLTDFKIPFDNHKVGMRQAITQWMAEKKAVN